MLLAVDIGNSNVVIGCIDGDKVKHVFRMVTDTSKTEDEYIAGLQNVLRTGGLNRCDFDGAVISSVVPPLVPVFENAVKRTTGFSPLIVGPGLETGLNIMLDSPEQLGSDLISGSVAAITYYKPPVLVIDMGTATTMAVIDSKSNYIGGAIIPGLAISMNALAGRTAQLPEVPIEAPEKCICSNTVDCMKSGAVFGAASMIDGMIDRMEAELEERATVVATGGLSSKIIKHCRHEILYDENLLLRGLAVIYEKNRKKLPGF